jgi:Uma2 family endonuclease
MDPKFIKAEEIGIRLEIVRGLPIWEAHPALQHQLEVDRIRASIRVENNDGKNPCLHIAGIYVSFADGSLKRPDISIFCEMPAEKEEAVTLVPEAVIEVISKGYEAKDLELGPSFYLSQGVKDVIVFDPYTLLVLHIRRDGTKRLVSPVALKLECGCRCTV